MRRLSVLAVLLVMTACSSATDERQCFASPEVAGADHAVVSWGNVCVPAGRFIIVRHGSFVAAIRFLSLHTADENYHHFANFELYERKDGAGAFRDGRFRRSAGRVSRLSSVGVHPFVIAQGDWRIRTTDVTLVYDGHACLAIPHDAQIAPTSWTRIEDVDATDAALQWFIRDATMMRDAIEFPR
jgi:hypothetical protein